MVELEVQYKKECPHCDVAPKNSQSQVRFFDSRGGLLHHLKAPHISSRFCEVPPYRLLFHTPFLETLFDRNILESFHQSYKSLGAKLEFVHLSQLPRDIAKTWWSQGIQQALADLPPSMQRVWVLSFDQAAQEKLAAITSKNEAWFTHVIYYSVHEAKPGLYKIPFPFYQPGTTLRFLMPAPQLLSRLLPHWYGDAAVLPEFGFGEASAPILYEDLRRGARPLAIHLPNYPENLTRAHGGKDLTQISVYLHDLVHLHEVLILSPAERERILAVTAVLRNLSPDRSYLPRTINPRMISPLVYTEIKNAIDTLVIELLEGQFNLIGNQKDSQGTLSRKRITGTIGEKLTFDELVASAQDKTHKQDWYAVKPLAAIRESVTMKICAQLLGQ